MPRRPPFAPVLAAAALLTPAAAQAEEPDKTLSVTISPLHLISPILEITAEKEVAEQVSIAGIGGIGEANGFGTWELGGQGRYYTLGTFERGAMVGGELLLVGVSGNGATGSGVAVGPFFGGKYTFDFGLTLDGQLGLTYQSVTASAGSVSTGASGLGVLLNLNLGWSF